MFWSKLCKSTWNCAWNLTFAVFISPIVWNMCENLPYESVYFKELHNEQECYWATINRAGAAVVSTIPRLHNLTSAWPVMLLANQSTFGMNNVSFEVNFRERKILKYIHVKMALWLPFVASVTCSRYQIAFKWSVKFWLQLFSIRWDGKYLNGWNFYLGILQFQENWAGRNLIHNELACVFTAHYASKNKYRLKWTTR